MRFAKCVWQFANKNATHTQTVASIGCLLLGNALAGNRCPVGGGSTRSGHGRVRARRPGRRQRLAARPAARGAG
eukprot:13252827-Alexandrium_andersonii.AAC.1